MALAFVGYYLNGTNPLQTSIGTLLMLNLVITFVFPEHLDRRPPGWCHGRGAVCVGRDGAAASRATPTGPPTRRRQLVMVLSVAIAVFTVQ